VHDIQLSMGGLPRGSCCLCDVRSLASAAAAGPVSRFEGLFWLAGFMSPYRRLGMDLHM
jgi:hypothetical protein